MLKTLFISNYALIDELEIQFDKGLNIITGETGAGKSIILGALSLILGDRANVQAMRNQSRKTVVEACFSIDGYDLKTLFADGEIDDMQGECILRREVNASGRSRAFINDTPVQLSLLKEIATQLIDIHSQHSNMLLASEAFQLSILDSIAKHQSLLDQYSEKFRTMKALEHELQELEKLLSRSRADEDYLRFQLNQLSELHLVESEDEELEQKQKRLANVNELKQQLWQIQSLLDSDENSIIESLKQVLHNMTTVEQSLAETEGMSERIDSSIIDLKDIASTISSLQDSLLDDPQELSRIDDRLNAIYTLERKHGVGSVNALLEVQNEYEQKLSAIDHSDERIHQLENELEQCLQEATRLADEMSAARKNAARDFETQLKSLAVRLGLKNLNFIIDLKKVELNATGGDLVSFLVSFNKNQLPMLVRDTASGGEISRLMLCIKAIVAQSMNLPTLILDEVDTGVSGDTASMVGELMGDIAHNIQVVAITHLPQVAAQGNKHLKVYKTDNDVETLTSVTSLNDEERVMEIARMLSGRELNQAAIENAKSLINQHK